MADSNTTKLNLTLPEVGVSTTWATSLNGNFTTLDESVLLDSTQSLTNKTLTDCDATTQSVGNNSTKVATTAFVTAAVALENTLAEMDDVVITSSGDNDVVAYDSTSQKYINQTAAEAGLQPTIADGDLTIAKTSGLQTALNGKQATIADGDLTIARTSGLQTALNGKQATIADGDLTIAKTNGLQAALDAKQATIADGDLTIAKTNGLQAALDAKQATISSSARLNADLIHDGTISNTEFGHLNGVSSNIQTQLNGLATEADIVALSIALG